MKSLVRWSALFGLVGATTLTACLGHPLKAVALPEEQIVKTLSNIPVFTVADEKGSPLTAQENNQQIAGVFISQKDAQNFIQQLQQKNPEIAKKVKVIPIPLAEVYKLAQASEKNPKGLIFDYVPTQNEVELAKKLLSQSGQEYKGGVPLFVALGGKDQGYFTIQYNNEQRIPFFFDKEQAQSLVDQYKKAKPELASTIKINVIPLEILIATLKEKNDKTLTKILLVPSQETLEFIRANAKNQPQAQPQAQPK